MRGGRWFADLDGSALCALIAEVPGLGVDRVDVTADARARPLRREVAQRLVRERVGQVALGQADNHDGTNPPLGP